ncbi:MAG TPA: hypothetical protein VK969_01880 [Acidimicrobiia bacterium]|nr:hypothetical protein [Acidimicrobiia bacterium]
MRWTRTRMTIVLSAIALVVVSCGGGGDASTDATDVDPGPTAESEDESTDTEEPNDEADVDASSGDEDSGERMAVITIDGESTSFALDDVTFSPVEGVDDLTFETCNPDFFGSGRFYAIGYAVDADGELILGEDGQPGTLTMDLPPDDWEATQRDAPEFEIELGDIAIEIATPEEAAGGTMAWTIGDTTASGSAVFVDFENTYTVDFEVVCEGSPTVDTDALPTDSDSDDRGDAGGLPAAGGAGSFTVDGESFDNVDVYSCEPFSFGSDPDPRDLSLLAYLGGMDGLQVEVSHSTSFDMSDGTEFDQINLSVFHSRQGEAGLEQFEGSAASAADGSWFTLDPETFEQVPFDENPVAIDGDRITGSLAGLDQTWPDEGAATVDVTWDLEIPTEVVEDC